MDLVSLDSSGGGEAKDKRQSFVVDSVDVYDMKIVAGELISYLVPRPESGWTLFTGCYLRGE